MADLVVTVKQLQQSSTSESAIREHKVLVDRPGDKGGQDRGPMGGELLLAALGGCFMSNLIAAAGARSVTVEGLAVVVRGWLAAAPPRLDRDGGTGASRRSYGARQARHHRRARLHRPQHSVARRPDQDSPDLIARLARVAGRKPHAR